MAMLNNQRVKHVFLGNFPTFWTTSDASRIDRQICPQRLKKITQNTHDANIPSAIVKIASKCQTSSMKHHKPPYVETIIHKHPHHKHPAGPEAVPIKRTFFKKMVILPQCRADLMIGNPGKTWGVFFGFSASSLQRMRRYQLAVSILVNASPLPSSSIHHQEVTFGTQVAGNWLFHQIPLSAA